MKKYFSFIFLFILTLLQQISYAKENLKSTSENDDEYIKFTEFTVEKHNYINFKYDNPINGIKVTGVFKPKGWGCRGTVTGEVTFTFTRLSDKKSFKFNLKNESLFDSSICKEKELNKDGEGKCIIRKNLIFKYDNNINIFEEKEDQTEFITQLLSIIDNGKGITKEGIQKLFGNFNKLDENKEQNIGGTGLGLAICK